GGQDRVARTGWPGPGGQDRVARTGWPGPGGQDRVARTLRELDGLAGVRAGTDTVTADRAPTFYTGRIAELSSVDHGLDSSADPALRRGVATLEALGDAKESTAQDFRTGEFLQFVTMRAAKDAATLGRWRATTSRTTWTRSPVRRSSTRRPT
ncbi:nitrate- and nitrite sensing domain-containing protein, partial [Actinoplanes sp. NPDC051494]|uniref:nitrate- and nitrite sensing domain-containing protein n=1 Tax=Actinoplanes sp. NPDC051494 TaxID=3363907 RepID=UPI0037A3E56B